MLLLFFSLEEPGAEEVMKLVENAVKENNELKALLGERNNEIQKLNEQIQRNQTEDPHIIEQRLLQSLKKLKTDFQIMYENQSNFFLYNLDRLKQAQVDNIDRLYKH